jgi:hypothetical protein
MLVQTLAELAEQTWDEMDLATYDLRDELTHVASDRAVAPGVVIMDATGLDG